MEGVQSESPDLQHATDPTPPEAPARIPLEAFMTEDAPTQFTLVFPWGECVIQDRVIVGRDYRVSPFGEHLPYDLYDLVSGIHAEIWVDDKKLHLKHVGRHPIQVNDTAVHNGDSRELKPGDMLDFSGQLIVRVKK